MNMDERAKAFRKRWNSYINEGENYVPHPCFIELKAELDWAEKNPPYAEIEFREEKGYQAALAFVRSLLKEPKEEK